MDEEELVDDELVEELLELGSSSKSTRVFFLDTLRRSCLICFGFRVVIGLILGLRRFIHQV